MYIILLQYEKATVALYLNESTPELGVVFFRIFQLFLWLLFNDFNKLKMKPRSN